MSLASLSPTTLPTTTVNPARELPVSPVAAHRNRYRVPCFSCAGISFTEILVALTVLGVLAVVATPHFESTDPHKLDRATHITVEAMRFARSEAIRTGRSYGVSTSVSDQQLRVYWWDETGSSPTAVYDVYHPLNKNLYTVNFAANSAPATAIIEAVYFKFDGVSADGVNDILFAGESGTPRYQTSARMLEQGRVTIALNNNKRIIDIAPFTGRVTVQ